MDIQAEISLYPLRTHEVDKTIVRFIECVRRPGLTLEIGPMSSRISGEPIAVFDALRDAFTRLAEEQQVVLTVKISNACPTDVAPEQDK